MINNAILGKKLISRRLEMWLHSLSPAVLPIGLLAGYNWEGIFEPRFRPKNME